jgi:hypothetical protein
MELPTDPGTLRLIALVSALQIGQMLLEYWLGKTNRVKSGSILELGMVASKLLVSKLNPEKELSMQGKNLIEVVDAGLIVVKLGIDVGKDGKVDAQDLQLVLGAIPALAMAVPAAISDADQIPTELSQMTEEDAAAVVGHVMSKLAVDNVKAQRIAERSLKLAVAVYGLVKEIAS